MNEQYVTHADLDKLKASIESSLERMETRIMSYLANDREHIKDDLNQHKEWHKQHFQKGDKLTEKLTDTKETLEKQITDSRISVIRDIAKENDKQDDVISKLSDRVIAIESESKGKHSQIALVISVIGVLAAVGAFLKTL